MVKLKNQYNGIGKNMKQKTYPPLGLVKEATQKFPKIWENFKIEAEKNKLQNPMFIRDEISVNVLRKYNENLKGDISWFALLETLYLWRSSKNVYRFDNTVRKMLFEQINDDTEIQIEVLKKLPYPAFYIELPDACLPDSLGKKQLYGFFVHVTQSIQVSKCDLIFNFILNNGDTLNTVIDLNCKFLSEAVDKFYTDIEKLEPMTKFRKTEKTQQYFANSKIGFKEITEKALQLVLYICSKSNDILENAEQKKIYKASQSIHDKFSEIKKFDVGFRIGAAIRDAKKPNANVDNKEQSAIDDKKIRKSPIAHERRAHWQHYWVGEKGNKQIIIKWILPTFVNWQNKNEESPVVIHTVK